MYCPNCANPIDGTQKFCRACGSNVSLVPQAMTGRLPEPIQVGVFHGRHRRREKRPPSIEGAVSSFFAGIGFLAVSIAIAKYAPAGQVWWFWMLIPAFSCIGAGVGQYLKLKEAARQSQQSFDSPAPPMNFPAPSQQRAAELPAPTTSELIKPSSVTEHTTRHLEQQR